MGKYPKTDQQKRVVVGGALINKVCKGKKGKAFRECRVEVLKCAFHDGECNGELLRLKDEILEKD
jgi:hypothetical protein